MMRTKRLVCHGAAFLLAAAWCGVPPRAFAQAGDYDVGEIAALGGGVFGAGSHGTATGSAGVAFSRHGMVLFNTSYIPMGNNTIQPWPDRATINHSYTLDFGFDFHIRFPIRNRWEPYGIVGAGALWNVIRQNTFDVHDVRVVRHFDQWNGALHTGGGLRYYIGQNWGIRPECRVIVSKHTYTQLTVGIFYVTPPDWP
jgi:hypothetical protein